MVFKNLRFDHLRFDHLGFDDLLFNHGLCAFFQLEDTQGFNLLCFNDLSFLGVANGMLDGWGGFVRAVLHGIDRTRCGPTQAST